MAFGIKILISIFTLPVVCYASIYELACPNGFCHSTRPFCRHIQCLTECPRGTFNNNFTCVDECPEDLPYIMDGNCTEKCENEKPYTQGSYCVSECYDDMFIEIANKTCVEYCDVGSVLFNRTCLFHCPSHVKWRLKQKLKYYNHILHRNVEADVIECVESCPDSTVAVNDECLFSCPQYHVLFNRTCFHTCPESHSFLIERVSDYGRIAECVDSCPVGLVVDDRSCVEKCPDDKFLQNETCVLQCSDSLFVCNKADCIISAHIHGEKVCVPECPTKHSLFNNHCVRLCYDTARRYSQNGICVHQCSSNLSLGYEKRCVDACPRGQYIFDDGCVQKCPLNTILVNETCYGTCPDFAPYKYTHPTRTFSYIYYRYVTQVQCLSACPQSMFYHNTTCVSKCPSGIHTLLMNRTCLNSCPKSHPYSFTIFRYSETEKRCVDQKPEDSYNRNGTFFNHCPEEANYSYKNSCFTSCPKQESYNYHHNRAIHCVDRCPQGLFILNDTCISRCPMNYRILNKVTCVETCPSEYPVSYLFYSIYVRFTPPKCLDECPFGTVRVKGSCESSCPANEFILNDECVAECPRDHMVLSFRRKDKGAYRRTYNNEEELFCIALCRKTHVEDGCVIRTTDQYVFVMPCNTTSARVRYEMHKCLNISMYNFNGTLKKRCPDKTFSYLKDCVPHCPKNKSFIDPSRNCKDRCEDDEFIFEDRCLTSCPLSNVIIDNHCKATNTCFQEFPFKLHTKQGTKCMKQCPSDYYTDFEVSTCVQPCQKKIFGKSCVSKCPSSHPFSYQESYRSETICYDVCPDTLLGNTSTMKCMYNFECEYYQYDKKCYKTCPPNTFSYDFFMKTCHGIPGQVAGIVVCTVLISGIVIVNLWCFTEDGVFLSIWTCVLHLFNAGKRKAIQGVNIIRKNPTYQGIDDGDIELEPVGI